MIQSEAQLEAGLVKRLNSLGWETVAITDGAGLRANLKAQMETQNGVSLSEAEFSRVLNHLDKGNVFDKAKILRDRMALPRDDGTTTYLQFLNTEEWCRNRYQVASQVIETVLLAPYEEYVAHFNAAVARLLEIAPDVDSVNDLQTEGEMLAFVQAFRELIRVRNVLGSFTQFSPDDLSLNPQKFEDYKSKYLDIYDRTKRAKEADAASIIDEVDFELELIQRDEINVAYILGLLAEVSRDANSLDATQRDESERKRKLVMDMLGSEAQLRSKRELIERFIKQHMPKAQDNGVSVEEAFMAFWNDERVKAMETVCAEEGIAPAAFQRLVEDYQFTGKPPLREAIIDVLEQKPMILERKKITERIIDKLLGLVATFDDGLGGI